MSASPPLRVVLATHNAHKLREFERLVRACKPVGAPLELELLSDDAVAPPETGTSFAENAIIKARAAAQATGLPALADDSGIEAAALDGQPGVLSARFAGPDASDAENLAKFRVLVPVGSALSYRCALAYVHGDEVELFEGSCAGTMSPEPKGDGGFGYDPIFLVHEDRFARTMAQLSDDEKDALSHRGQALRKFQKWLAR